MHDFNQILRHLQYRLAQGDLETATQRKDLLKDVLGQFYDEYYHLDKTTLTDTELSFVTFVEERLYEARVKCAELQGKLATLHDELNGDVPDDDDDTV